GVEDASFTFERDVKVGIDGLAERLGAITFFAGAGTYADKAERLVKLVEALGGGYAAREAARLAKADQAAELVREFPDLEGHVGAEYAALAGYPEAVSAAIDEQYLPDAADAPLPQTETGRVLSAADKIDTLNVSFGLGHKPTGSRDPYGLRRAAIGLDRLATEGKLAIPRLLLTGEVGGGDGARAGRLADRGGAGRGRRRCSGRGRRRAGATSRHVLRRRARDGRGQRRAREPSPPAPQRPRHPRPSRRAIPDSALGR